MTRYQSTKMFSLGSAAFRQWRATHSHCSKLHGYNLTAKIWFSCESLDDNHWVMDFGSFGELRTLFADMFDHKTCVSSDDPELELFNQMESKGIINLRVYNGVGIEKFAEYVATLTQKYVSSKTNNRVYVDKVEVFEHELNSAMYVCELPTAKSNSTTDTSSLSYSFLDGTNSIESGPNTPPPALENSQQPQQMPVQPPPPQKIAAPVGQKPTQGKGNWFAGTSWG